MAATALPLRCPRPGSGRPSCVLHGPPDGALTSGWPSARPSPQQRLASALLRSWGVPGYSCACSQLCFTGWPRGPQGWPEGGGAKVGRRSVPAWRLSVEHCPHPAPARSAARASAQSAGPLRRGGVGGWGGAWEAVCASYPRPPLHPVRFLQLPACSPAGRSTPGAWAVLAQPVSLALLPRMVRALPCSLVLGLGADSSVYCRLNSR